MRLSRVARLLTPIVLVAALAWSGIAAATGVTDLGKPTNDLSYVGILGSFRHTGDALRQHGKPELLFLGAEGAEKVEPERWAVIKALSQFGRFSRVTAWPASNGQLGAGYFPGFNLSRMLYSSRYVAFVNKDLVNVNFRPLKQKLSRQEHALFEKYSNPLGPRAELSAAVGAALSRPGSKSLPLLVIGGYVQTWPSLPVADSDFQKTVGTALPDPCPPQSCTGPYYVYKLADFSDIQRSLQTGHAVNGLPQSLVTNINAESNILTAIICHTDGRKPAGVCNRSVIRKILKSVR